MTDDMLVDALAGLAGSCLPHDRHVAAILLNLAGHLADGDRATVERLAREAYERSAEARRRAIEAN